MPETRDKNLELLKSELQFIRRQLARIEGDNSDDYEATDEIFIATDNALRALHEYELSIQPNTTEEIPAGVKYPAVA